MWLWRSPSSSTTINTYEKFEKLDCTNRYGIYKKEIEDRINDFNNRRYTPFKKHWDTINNYIKEKNYEITPCVNKKYISVDFYADESIKYFSERCRNASTCRHNPASPVKKPRASQAETKTTCKGGVKCNKQLSSTQPANSKSQLSVAQEPKARSPKVHVSPEQVQKRANAQESQQENENVKVKQDIKPFGDSVGSEPNLNSNTSPSGESENKAQSLPVLANPANNELGSGLKVSAPQNTPEGESVLSDTSKVTILHRSNIQNGLNILQDVDNESSASHSNGHLNLVSKFSCPGDSTVEGIGAAHTCPRTADRVHYTEQSPDIKAAPDGDTHSGIGDNGGITVSSVPSKGDNGDLAEHNPTHGQDDPVISSQFQDHDHKSSCREGDTFAGNDNEMTCSAEKGNEIDTNNGNILDTLSGFFNGIQSNPQIIKTSAPIGIALLLGLLFKFTPMWRVLTKKNRKKGAGINEELNSVLQEPSIMDDERSIPFSYGAFEYSTFDQNSY